MLTQRPVSGDACERSRRKPASSIRKPGKCWRDSRFKLGAMPRLVRLDSRPGRLKYAAPDQTRTHQANDLRPRAQRRSRRPREWADLAFSPKSWTYGTATNLPLSNSAFVTKILPVSYQKMLRWYSDRRISHGFRRLIVPPRPAAVSETPSMAKAPNGTHRRGGPAASSEVSATPRF